MSRRPIRRLAPIGPISHGPKCRRIALGCRKRSNRMSISRDAEESWFLGTSWLRNLRPKQRNANGCCMGRTRMDWHAMFDHPEFWNPKIRAADLPQTPPRRPAPSCRMSTKRTELFAGRPFQTRSP